MSSVNNQFRIDLPDDWADKSAYSFMGPEENGVQHLLTLTIDREIEDDDLTEFAQARIEILRGSLQGMEILKEDERTLENGIPVYEMACRWIPVDGTVLFQKYYYLIVDGAGYTFTGTFSKRTLKTVGVVVERMINSFRPAMPQSDDEI